MAKACATELDGTFFAVSSANLISKWMGESEKLVKGLFELARKSKPAVIFLDEIDSVMTKRSEGDNAANRRVITEFLVQMQGVGNDDTGILVLGATNIPWELDPAVRRRFEKKIYIPLPDLEARIAMLKIHLGNTPTNMTDDQLEELAEMLEGYSGSDCSTLVKDAIIEPIRKCKAAKYFKMVNGLYVPCSPSDPDGKAMSLFQLPDPSKLKAPLVEYEDFLKALTSIKKTVSEQDLVKQEEFTSEFGMEG